MTDTNNPNVSRVLLDILKERDRQNEKWGGPEHDDTHGAVAWIAILVNQVSMVKLEDLRGTFYAAMIRVAAVAIAAAESYKRKDGMQRDDEDCAAHGEEDSVERQ